MNLKEDELMASDTSVETLAAQLLQAVDGLIDWGAIPEDVRRKKYSIVSKRVAGIAKSAKSLDEFLERFLKELAGDALCVSRDKAKQLKDILDQVKADKKCEEEVLQYIKRHPYLSVVAYAARIEEGR
jgi:hypothetical protein